MSPSAESNIRALLTRINEAWLHLRGPALTQTLAPCFGPEVVMRGPAFALFGRGRDFAVQSFHDFVSQAEVHAFSTEPAEVDLTPIGEPDTAVAQYRWRMTYSLPGPEGPHEYTEEGYDLYVLSHRSGQWQVTWRAMLPQPMHPPK